MIKRIKVEDLYAQVRIIAEEHPERIYHDYYAEVFPEADHAECAYFLENGAPGCIVGHALHRLGINAQDVEEMNTGIGVTDLLDSISYVDPMDRRQMSMVNWLTIAQSAQDRGEPWSSAIIEADAKNEA